MPTPPHEPSQSPTGDTNRDFLLLWTETLFTFAGYGLGTFSAIFIFKTAEKALGNPNLSGWFGCLDIWPIALGFMLWGYLCMLLGWWLWLRLFVRRLVVSKRELYLLATGPANFRLVARLPLRIAGVSKAEEEQFSKDRMKHP